VFEVRRNIEPGLPEKGFDLVRREAVLLAFAPVPIVPLEV
jgi:hypothetical protein